MMQTVDGGIFGQTMNCATARVSVIPIVRQTHTEHQYLEKCPQDRTWILPMNKTDQPKEQFKVEIKAVLKRWFVESDMDAEDLSNSGVEAIDEWLDDDVIEFEPE
jgi:hypothetical protein|tara:strand:- start:777 stop:1091 length:315 start_codon:yes stop_codon:yes gene_type:complete